jgi:hypothetical protein
VTKVDIDAALKRAHKLRAEAFRKAGVCLWERGVYVIALVGAVVAVGLVVLGYWE